MINSFRKNAFFAVILKSNFHWMLNSGLIFPLKIFPLNRPEAAFLVVCCCDRGCYSLLNGEGFYRVYLLIFSYVTISQKQVQYDFFLTYPHILMTFTIFH